MLQLFTKLIAWILGIWKDLPQPIKDKIIEVIVDSFDHIFRKYYRKKKVSG
jgi:hypothetical protein